MWKSVIKSGLRPIETPVSNRNDVYRVVWSKWGIYKYTRNTKRKSHYVTVTNVIKRNAYLQEFTGWILKVLFGSYFSDVVYID